MQIITLIADQISPEALNAALPADGIASVTIGETQAFSRSPIAVESHRGRKIAKHITTVYRVEIVAEESAVAEVVEGITFARGAGLLGDARAWISAQTADLFAANSAAMAV